MRGERESNGFFKIGSVGTMEVLMTVGALMLMMNTYQKETFK